MIIINTNFGERFVNDKEVIDLYHDADENYVTYTSRADNNCIRINNVMAVTYISDTMQANLTFNGKELERIYADNADKENKIHELEKRLHVAETENETDKTRLEDAKKEADNLLANNQKLQDINGTITTVMDIVLEELERYEEDANLKHLKKIYTDIIGVKSVISRTINIDHLELNGSK